MKMSTPKKKAPAKKVSKASKTQAKAPKTQTKASKAKAKATPKKAPKPTHKLSGHRLFFIPKEEGSGADHRRQKDSRRSRSRGIIAAAGKKGILFEDALKKGAHPFDLNRDLKKGAYRVEAPKAKGS
jgi:hypothetical protein